MPDLCGKRLPFMGHVWFTISINLLFACVATREGARMGLRMIDDAHLDAVTARHRNIAEGGPPAAMRRQLVESLYLEAMVLADEVRSYFERGGQQERMLLVPVVRIGYSCESLKATTRLMHVIAWLLTQRAVDAGEIGEEEARNHDLLLADAVPSDPEMCRKLPDTARLLIASSEQLYKRTLRLQELFLNGASTTENPVHEMMYRLQSSY